jgi:hypothetical protein
MDINGNRQIVWKDSNWHTALEDGEHYEVDTWFLNYVELSPRYDLHPGSRALEKLKEYAAATGSKSTYPLPSSYRVT